MASKLFCKDVADMSCLTTEQLTNLRVDNTADQFTLSRHVYQLASHLNLSPADTITEIKSYRAMYCKHKHEVSGIVKDFRQCLMYCLRWRCRGLSHEQSIQKLLLTQQQRKEWAIKQRSYWSKPNAKKTNTSRNRNV